MSNSAVDVKANRQLVTRLGIDVVVGGCTDRKAETSTSEQGSSQFFHNESRGSRGRAPT